MTSQLRVTHSRRLPAVFLQYPLPWKIHTTERVYRSEFLTTVHDYSGCMLSATAGNWKTGPSNLLWELYVYNRPAWCRPSWVDVRYRPQRNAFLDRMLTDWPLPWKLQAHPDCLLRDVRGGWVVPTVKDVRQLEVFCALGNLTDDEVYHRSWTQRYAWSNEGRIGEIHV